jgi:hypothetical protein
MSYNWNWSWVSAENITKKTSEALPRATGTVYQFRQAQGGQLNTEDINAFVGSVGQNIYKLWSLWKTQVRPILDSLPAGGKDTRWTLRDKIDCLNYGLQGSTLFVFNDANATKADGRYWHTDDNRPLTIAEVFDEHNARLATVESGQASSASSSVELDPLWAAIGNRYESVTLVSAPTSLDARANVMETYFNQLATDIYGKTGEGYTSWGWGSPLTYSITANVDYLLKIHDIASGWQSDDPANVGHNTLESVLLGHTHTQDEIPNWPSSSVLARKATSTLANDIERLRWEVDRTRGGTTWQDDVRAPWLGSGNTTFYDHMNFVGNGTPSATNPHGSNYRDTGAWTLFQNVGAFIGMSNPATGETPNYTSNRFVADGDSLETAISKVDAAITTGTTRKEYTVNRSAQTELWREQNPIVIYHGGGIPPSYGTVITETDSSTYERRPILQVLDTSPQEEDTYGQYASWYMEVNLVHVDSDTVEIWTTAARVRIIAIY